MNSSEKFYREKLYPLQDGILKLVKELNLPFYLTGGTALSRFYYNHRYSDDLDFFVNDDPRFQEYLQSFFDYFQKNKEQLNYKIDIDRTKIASSFASTYISLNDIELKIDLVNDIPVHYGELINHELGSIDNWRNILSNKISALSRFELKDYADVWVLTKNNKFNWKEILREAKEKDLAVDPIEVYNLFMSFPFNKLSLIKWIKAIDEHSIQADFKVIANDILQGKYNSLAL